MNESRGPNLTLQRGGWLMILAGAFNIVFAVAPKSGLVGVIAHVIAAALFLTACVVFAAGPGGDGNVVDGSRRGQTWLIGTGVAYATVAGVRLIFSLIGEPAWLLVFALIPMLAYTVFAVLAAVAAAKSHAVPRPWRFAPVYGVLVYAACTIVNWSTQRFAPMAVETTTLVGDILVSLVLVAYGAIAIYLAPTAKLQGMAQPT